MFRYWFTLWQSVGIVQSGLIQSVFSLFGMGLLLEQVKQYVELVGSPSSPVRGRYCEPGHILQPSPVVLLNLPGSQA